MTSTTTIERLASDRLFTGPGRPIHVNHPQHQGHTPLHDHDFLEIALVDSGRAIHRTVDGEEPIGPGMLFILHPGQWHAYEQCRDLVLFNCCVGIGVLTRELGWMRDDPRFSRLLPSRLPGRGGPHPYQSPWRFRLGKAVADGCRVEMQRMHRLLTTDDTGRLGAEPLSRVMLLLDAAARHLPAVQPGDQPTRPAPGTPVGRCLAAMEDRMRHPWGLEELCRVAAVSRFHLVREFRRHLGLAPMAWLTRRRLDQAAIFLLTTDLGMAEIGRRVGWDDANYFSRRFRAAFGISPREYRERLPMPAAPSNHSDWVQWQA